MGRTKHWALRYGIAVLAIIWSTSCLLLFPTIARSGVAIPFFAVFISAWFGGFGPGAFTTAVGLALYLIVLIHRGSPFPLWQYLQIAAFVAGGVMITVLVEALHAARRRAEANEWWLSAVLTSIGDAVIATDGQGRVCFTNPIARSLTSGRRTRPRASPCRTFPHRLGGRPPAGREPGRSGASRGNRGRPGEAHRPDRPRRDRAADRRHAAPIKDRDGKIVGVVLVFRDVTEERRHEEERDRLLAAEQTARSEAESANLAKDRFLAVLSHELRTPLTPVLIAASSLLERGDHFLDPDVRSVLEMVKRNVELESRLIDDLLDVSRIARGRLFLDLEAVDVHRAIRDCVEICGVETLVAGLDVKLDLAAGDHQVTGDHARLMQVVWNLIRNAVRFTPSGGILTIRTSNTAGPGDEQGNGPGGAGLAQRLIVEFADTGIGIDDAIRERIFDPFYQADAESAPGSGGLGLGLAISRSITEEHGGRLSSEESRSRARVHVSPRAQELSPAVATRSPEPIKTPSNPTSDSGLNILLVEDNKDTLHYLTLILQRRNYKVVPADCVSTALAAAGESYFDLLISDIELPDGTGLELMHGLGGGRTLPGIAMSGFGAEEDLRDMRVPDSPNT